MLNLIDVDKKIKIKTHQELINAPIIVRVKAFDEDSVERFSLDMIDAHETGQPIIPIVIDSWGGDVYGLFAMLDIIKNAKVPVATIVEGKALSAGADLLCAGTEGYRFAAPTATIMIHEAATHMNHKKIEEMKVDLKETERLNDLSFKIMAKNCGKPEKYFTDIIHKKGHADWYLTAAEAKKHNIVNHIKIPEFKTRVVVETLFE